MGTSNNGMIKGTMVGIATTLGTHIIKEGLKEIKSKGLSTIEVCEWDNAYQNVNKIIYSLDKRTFTKHRLPTANKSHYELSINTKYRINLKENNYINVTCYRDELKQGYQEHRLKLTFHGNDKYRYRAKILKSALKLSDKNHIKVLYLGKDQKIFQDILPHKFDNVVLNKTVKDNIINGLVNWKNSKEWYRQHELTYKIGVFLYGKAGTGKSTVAKSISSMFGNAPIVTVDADNIIESISSITRLRNQIDGTIIVLIEDFDMFFKSREELEDIEMDIKAKKQKDSNQNAIFQMLDGMFSTENTIYIATTNYKDRIDSALIRYGRFDIQEELDYFSREQAIESVKILGYNEDVLDSLNLEYPIQPSFLQSKIMEYRAKKGASICKYPIMQMSE